VLATQNPIELEGTYALPEAQLDRFLFNTVLDYLSADDEVKVVDLTTTTHVAQVDPVTSAEEILDFQKLVRMVPIGESLARYVVEFVRATRHNSGAAPDFVKKYVNYGGSVRAAQFIVLSAKARALTHHRYNVAYEDITALAIPVLRHRIISEFPCGIGPHRFGRNPAPAARTHAAALEGLRKPDAATLLRSVRARRNLRSGPGGEDCRRRVRRRSSPLAGFRIQPGVRRIPRLFAGR